MSQASQSSKSAKAAIASRASAAELRDAVCGKHLSTLLGQGSYASGSASISGGSFSGHLRGQYAQPRQPGSEGAQNGRTFIEQNYPKPRVLETHFLEVNRYCFKNPASPVLMSAVERFKQMSLNPPYAMLACIQLVTDVENGEPIYGDPFLTVLGAPASSPPGEITTPTEIWPGLSELQPIGYELDDDPISIVGASMQHITRSHFKSKVSTTLESFLPHIVYTLAGTELCEVGFVLTASHAPSGAALLYKPNPSTEGIGMDINSHTYMGAGDYKDLIDSDKHQAVLLPVAMPLPFAHSIPIGQIFKAEGGFKGFRNTLVDMVGNDDADADARARLGWIEDSPYLEEWLDAVSANPQKFMVPFIARESIVESLKVPATIVEGESAMITSDSLAPMLWIDYTIARNLQRDNIMATLSSTAADEYDRLELRQLENFQRSQDDPPSFGFPSITANAALWALRPPAAPSTRARFGMDSFLDKAVVPPQTEIYQPVEIPTGTRLPKNYAVVPLETVAEVEEAIAESAPANSPSKERARMRIESAKRKRLSLEQDSPKRPPPKYQSSQSSQFFHSGLHVGGTDNAFVTPTTKPPSRSGTLGGEPRVETLHRNDQQTKQSSQHRSVPAQHPATSSTSFASRPQPSAEAFGAPPLSSHPTLDPLAHSLHRANSVQRPAQSRTVTTTPGLTFAPATSAAAQSFLHPLQTPTEHQLVTPVPVQLLDSSGRPIQSGATTLYKKKDESTWYLDAQQQWGPANFNFFAQLLAVSGEEVRGVFTATNDPVPPGWSLYPSAIAGPFRRYFLVPDASGIDAQFYMQSLLHGAATFQIGIYVRPTSELGATFFTDKVFTRFRSPSRWLSIPLENDKPLDKMFTALDFNRLVPTSTDVKFHHEGETRDHMKKFLANTKFLFTVASQQDATLMPTAVNVGHQTPLLIIGIDWLLQALEEPRLQTEWSDRSIAYTSLVFEVFETLFLAFVGRQMAFISSHAALAEVTPVDSTGSAGPSVIMMNPASSQHYGAPTLVQRLIAWKTMTLPRIAEPGNRRIDHVLHPNGDQRTFLFQSAPAPTVGGAPRYIPDRYDQFPFVPPQVAAPAAAPPVPPGGRGRSDKRLQGENASKTSPPILSQATKPLMKWRNAQAARTPSYLLNDLRQQDSSIVLPTLLDHHQRHKQICFLFTTEHVSGTSVPPGCDGTMPSKGRGRPKKCNRVLQYAQI